MTLRSALATAAILAATAGLAAGFVFIGPKWFTSPVVMHLQLGTSGTLLDGSANWNDSAETALALWNEHLAGLQFSVVRNSTAATEHGDGVNNVFFSSDVYGLDFGDAVAITTQWTRRGNERTEADVVFNANLDWNSYRGNLRRAAGGGTLYDLRRVALHEFGHVLGLDHPDEAGQSVAAIMNRRVSNVDALLEDDIRGGQALYGARARAAASFGAFTRPRSSALVRTTASSYRFRGRANPGTVVAVHVANSRLGPRRFFKAAGVARWERTIPLRPGRNTIRLYATNPSGARVKVAQRVVIRETAPSG